LPPYGNEADFAASSLEGLVSFIKLIMKKHTSKSFDNQRGCLISEEMAYSCRVFDLVSILQIKR
jgi:hypothetical protein